MTSSLAACDCIPSPDAGLLWPRQAAMIMISGVTLVL
jgi:hypothetical protein